MSTKRSPPKLESSFLPFRSSTRSRVSFSLQRDRLVFAAELFTLGKEFAACRALLNRAVMLVTAVETFFDFFVVY